MKYLIKLSSDNTGKVIDADTLQRFIDIARDESRVDELPASALYVADRLAELLEDEG